MKKILALSALALMAAGGVKAQRLVFIYGHGQYNIPTGRLSNSYNWGLGAQGGVGVGLGGNFFVGSAGYQNFPKQKGVSGSSLTTLKAGYRRTFALKKLFMQINGGYGNLSPASGSNQNVGTADLAVGAKLAGLELTGAYESFFNGNVKFNGMFALKVGFNIGL